MCNGHCFSVATVVTGTNITVTFIRRLRLKRDGTRADPRLCLSAKRASPFKPAGASVQSNTGSRGVRISGSNAGYSMFQGSIGYWLPTPFASFPFTSPPVRHRVPSRFNWTLHYFPFFPPRKFWSLFQLQRI